MINKSLWHNGINIYSECNTDYSNKVAPASLQTRGVCKRGRPTSGLEFASVVAHRLLPIFPLSGSIHVCAISETTPAVKNVALGVCEAVRVEGGAERAAGGGRAEGGAAGREGSARVRGDVGTVGSWGKGNAFSLGPSKQLFPQGTCDSPHIQSDAFTGREFF